MFESTALEKLARDMDPMLKYLCGKDTREINRETIEAFCADLETKWNATNFPFKPTQYEVIEYYNLRKKHKPDDRALFASNFAYGNCDLFIFFTYFVLITSLDSYGPCETLEGAKRALARGTQALQTGVLVSHLKRLRPWTECSEEFRLSVLNNRPFGTSFTNLEVSPNKERLEIGRLWKEELLKAFGIKAFDQT
jgi:hypothetical protein